MRPLLIAVLAVATIGVLAPTGQAYTRPGRTEGLTVGADGEQPDVGSYPSLSADGRFVAFYTSASNMVPGDTNEVWDVFVRDRETGATERVSLGVDGAEGNDSSVWPSISADGTRVAFHSRASNLVPGDTNQTWDIFVRDLVSGTTERVSVASDGSEGFGISLSPSISGDGRSVAFHSGAPDLVPGDPIEGSYDVFVHDLETGTTERVSEGIGGTPPDSESYSPSVSADGQYVAFYSYASNLVADADTNGAMTPDVFVRDLETGTTERVSEDSDGAQGNSYSMRPAISAQGDHVAFYSAASNLVPWDTNGFDDVFVHDLATGRTERVSVGDDGTEGEKVSTNPSISADGRYVAFDSRAEDFVAEDSNEAYDVFVRDRELGTTERVSVATDGTQATPRPGVGPWDADSNYPSMSQDGRHVAFWSVASNLVPGDTNDRHDVFIRDRGRPIGVGDLSAVPTGDRISVGGWATFSGAVISSATDPSGDGATGTGVAGGDLTGASLTYHPENGSLLVRLPVASLPSFAGAAGYPAVLYGLRFELGGTRYEVRASTADATAADPSLPASFALYRCDPTCTKLVPLSGGLGTTTTEVLISLPLSVLGAHEDVALTKIQAFTALGEFPGILMAFDDADLPDATIPARQISVGLASSGTPEHDVAFDTEVPVGNGIFSESLDAATLSPGDHDLWARACLGEVCESARTPFSI